MAKLTTVTSGTTTSQQPQTPPETAPFASIDINALADTSNTPPSSAPPPEGNIPEVDEDAPLLEDELLLQTEETKAPKRSAPIKDITKNPLANTLAITLLSFGVIGGLAFIWWGISAAQNRISTADDTESLEDIVEDEKQKEIEELQQQLYKERANVALKDLKSEPDEASDADPEETAEEVDDQTELPTVATSSAPPPPTRRTSSPPPPPRRVTPTPVRTASHSASSSPAQPKYDSPNQWYELAALGQVTTTEFDPAIFSPPPLPAEETIASEETTELASLPQPAGGWAGTGLSVVNVSASSDNPWPSAQLQGGEISQGEIGILESQSVTQPPASQENTAPEAETQQPASSKSDPWKTAASTYSEADTVIYNADDFWDVEEGWDEPGTMYVEPDTPMIDAQIDQQEAIAHANPSEGWDEEAENAIAYVHDTPSNAPASTPEAIAHANDGWEEEATEAIAYTKASDTWDIEVDPDEGWADTATSGVETVAASEEWEDIRSSDTWEVAVDPNEGWEDTAQATTAPEQQTTVAIGTITNARVITPIIWDMEAPRATDGIFTIELTDPMEDINGQVVLPEGTRLVGDVSHVTSVGHVYQSIIAIHLPDGQQIPVPVIDHEAETGAPITPLVVRGKKGEALIADPVERSDGNRNSLGNDLLIGVVNGLADAADNALEPQTSVQVNQGFGSSTVESQENVNDPAAAFARGFLENTAYRMEEQLYEETEEILVFQVDAGEKVSVVVNGLMGFTIPAGGWPE